MWTAQAYPNMAAAILKGDLDNILEIIGEVHAFGHSIPDFYSSVIHYFRDLLVIKMVTATDRLLDLPDKEIEAMRDVVQGHLLFAPYPDPGDAF